MDHPDKDDTSISDRIRNQLIEEIKRSDNAAVMKLRPILAAQVADCFPTSATTLVNALLAAVEDSSDETS